MKCEKCSKEADIVIPYTQVGFCSKHFRDLTKKRVRLALKNHQMVEQGDSIGFLLEDHASGLTCPLIAKEILKSFPLDYQAFSFKISQNIRSVAGKLDLELEKLKKRNYEAIIEEHELDKLVLGRNLTQETDEFITALMKKDLKTIEMLGYKTEFEEGALIKPMLKVPIREARFYANSIKLDFKKKEPTNFEKEVHKLIEKVKERRANTRFSTLKVIESLKD